MYVTEADWSLQIKNTPKIIIKIYTLQEVPFQRASEDSAVVPQAVVPFAVVLFSVKNFKTTIFFL